MQALGSRSETLLFLPGAAGDTGLWQRVADGLSHGGARRFFRWPGLGGAPRDASVTGMADLVELVIQEISGPTVLFAQSMGGLIALRVALAVPEKIRALVLSVTSGGIDVGALGAADWRPQFEQKNPDTPRWFLDAKDDISSQLPEISAPALLLWGDSDPISPVAVGRRLQGALPQAELSVIAGGTHDLVSEHCVEVLPQIERFLGRTLAHTTAVGARG